MKISLLSVSHRESVAAAFGLMILLIAGCSGDPTCQETQSCPPDVPSGTDSTAPSIVAIDAGDDGTSKGVRSDAKIVVQFSEAMDRGATEGAYVSSDLPPETVSFSWSANDSVLTISPKSALRYAEGADPALVVPESYDLRITVAAQDLAGNALTKETDFHFSTLRRISKLIALRPVDGVTIHSSGAMTSCAERALAVGDDDKGALFRSFMTFDLSTLPTGIVQFESAILSASTKNYVTSAIPSLGSLLIQHTAIPLPLTVTALTAEPLSNIGVFADSGEPRAWSIDVASSVAEDYAERTDRADRSQYRFTMERATNNDSVTELVAIECTLAVPTMNLRYLIP